MDAWDKVGMASTARWGLKRHVTIIDEVLVGGRNGLYSPFGIETLLFVL